MWFKPYQSKSELEFWRLKLNVSCFGLIIVLNANNSPFSDGEIFKLKGIKAVF
jgi:hypothetical protein